MAAPEMVGGTDGLLDTLLMQTLGGKVVSKGGAEGLRAVGLLPGSRGEGRPAAGLAVLAPPFWTPRGEPQLPAIAVTPPWRPRPAAQC